MRQLGHFCNCFFFHVIATLAFSVTTNHFDNNFVYNVMCNNKAVMIAIIYNNNEKSCRGSNECAKNEPLYNHHFIKGSELKVSIFINTVHLSNMVSRLQIHYDLHEYIHIESLKI